jgi:hypothetical protein
MQVQDLTVEVRNSLLERVAQITEQDLVGFTVVLRFNNVGSWKVTLPAESTAAEALRQPGAGVIVTGPEGVIFTGPTTSAKKIQSTEDPQGSWEIEGVDDSIVLLERLGYPDPTEPDAGLQTVAYDEITGPASTVLYHYVNANLGPDAPIERQIANLELAPDTALGSTTTGKVRFDVLGSIFTRLVAPDGLGYDIKQEDDKLVFAVYQPVDRSGDIRLDVENNRLSVSEYTYENPKATRAIVAGQGQGEQRAILEVATTESEASETTWGRRIEVFKDQRDTSDNTLLEQSGLEILAKFGMTQEGISVRPSDDGLMRFGYDWNLGDKVSVVANEAVAVAVVTEVALSITESGVYVLATVGQPDTASKETKTVSVQNNQEDRISNLERNEPSGGGGGGGGGSVGYYGSFYDMTDQPLASITAAQPIAIGTTAEAVGISITSANRVLFANAGTYSMTFSIQLTNYANAVTKAVVWVKKNGIDYADSATELDLSARKSTGVPNRQVLTINYVATAAAGDYVQVFWAGDSLDLRVESLPAGTTPVSPAVPSIILTAVQVGNSGLVVSPSAPSSTGVLWLDTDEPSDIPVPIGGTANQVLAKIDSTNYNTQWITPPSVPAGGTTGQVLTKINATDYNANWQTPATPITPGLVPIIPSGVTTVSGSASIDSTTGLVTFTGVTTVNLDGVFSAAYNHYKILHVSSGASVNTEVNMRMRASGANYATANQRSHAIYYQGGGSAVTVTGGDSRDGVLIGWSQGVANTMNSHSVEVFNPFNTTRTTYVSTHTSYVSGTAQGGVPTNSSYTGFALITGGTHSGTIKVYGYN